YHGLGDLHHCREIALTNGSITTQEQQYPYGAALPDNSLIMSGYGYDFRMFAFVTANTWATFKAYTLPNRVADALIYTGKVDAYPGFLNIPVLHIPITNKTYKTSSTNTLAYENAPGGYIETGEMVNLESAILGGDGPFIK